MKNCYRELKHGDRFQAIRRSNGQPVKNGEIFTVKEVVSEDDMEWVTAHIPHKPLLKGRPYHFFTRFFDFYPVPNQD